MIVNKLLIYDLHNLKNIKLKVIGLGYIPEDGVVWGLLAGLDLLKRNMSLGRGFSQHFDEQTVFHKVRA